MKNTFKNLLVLAGLFAFRSVLADQYVVPSGSMEPTIQIGDHVLVNKAAYDLKIPFLSKTLVRVGEAKPGEVVVFRDPRDPGRTLIKRLIGVPGDRIRVRDGVVEVNGQTLRTSLAAAEIERRMGSGPLMYEEEIAGVRHEVQRLPHPAESEGREYREYVVPAGQYFFMGDNRDNSADSRTWGFASRENLEGRALRVIYSVTWPEWGGGWVPEVSFKRAGAPLGET